MVRLLCGFLFFILLAGAAQGQGFSVLWYWFDDGDGEPELPLTDACMNGTPLPDGTIVRIYWDNDDNGPDEDDPQPCVFDDPTDPPDCNGVNRNQFAMNGGAAIGEEGYFAMESAFSSVGVMPPEPHRYYLRICVGDIRWESSVMTITVGAQEFGPSSFAPHNYTWNCVETPCGFGGITFAWFDDGQGEPELPLTDSCTAGMPLPDGTPVRIYWDRSADGPDDFDPQPDSGLVTYNTFPMNGELQALGAGYFATETPFASIGFYPQPYLFYLRVCLPERRWESTTIPESLNFRCINIRCGGCPQPPPPEPVFASDTSCSGVRVTWVYPPLWDHIDRFLIYRNDILLVTITDTTQRAYFDSTAPEGVSVYGVQARRVCNPDSVRYSELSEDDGTRQPDPPLASNIAASDTVVSQVRVTWTCTSTGNLHRWIILRDSDSIGIAQGGGVPGNRTYLDLNPLEGVHVYDVHALGFFCGEGTSTGGDSGQALPDAADEALVPAITSYALYPAFPNPFNAETEIRFDLPRLAHVSLRIYDIMGREVVVLADQQYATGSHSISLDGSRFSSGLYFLTMAAGQFTQTQKLLLLK